MSLVDLGTLGSTSVIQSGLFSGQQSDNEDIFSFELNQQTNIEINGFSDTSVFTSDSAGAEPAYRVRFRIAEDLNDNNTIDNEEVLQNPSRLPSSLISDPEVVFQQELDTGDYLIELTPVGTINSPLNSSFSVNYEIEISPTLLDNPTDGDNMTQLEFNQVISGNIEPGERDIYTFNGSEGQRLYYDHLSANSVVREFVNGSVFLPSEVPGSDRDPFTLTEDDLYSFVFSGEFLSSQGTYSFRLLDIADAPEITIDNPENGKIDFDGEADLYRFSGSEGQELLIDNLDDISQNANFRLFDPDNELVEISPGLADFPVTLEKNGEYVLAVAGTTSSGEFDYSFVLTTPAENASPVAVDDTYNTNENTPLIINLTEGVLSNDTDPEEDPLTVTLSEGVENGNLELQSDGSFTYTPNDGFSGTDQFIYEVDDDNGGTDTATVELIVSEINDDNVTELEFNQVISGNIEPGERDTYTFNGMRGQRLYYDHLSANSVVRELDRKKHPITG
ncbi:MAG: Ig-like domain-containing protein [Xenococcaceae cyanobacterium MO_188.B29]|nr:Ig-like domain-containing protein [Xenococcaceae cyanobacterium MO_188.B29]